MRYSVDALFVDVTCLSEVGYAPYSGRSIHLRTILCRPLDWLTKGSFLIIFLDLWKEEIGKGHTWRHAFHCWFRNLARETFLRGLKWINGCLVRRHNRGTGDFGFLFIVRFQVICKDASCLYSGSLLKYTRMKNGAFTLSWIFTGASLTFSHPDEIFSRCLHGFNVDFLGDSTQERGIFANFWDIMSTCAEIFGLELARSTVISWSVWLVLGQLAARLDFVEVNRCEVIVLSPILFNIFLLGKLTVVTSGLLLSRWR